MSFSEKLQAVFDKYGTTELKLYTLLNLYDDVLDCYAEDQKEHKLILENYERLQKREAKYLKEREGRKQKLQQLQKETNAWMKELGDEICSDCPLFKKLGLLLKGVEAK